ncbi:hypothetical protein WG936_05470 [Corynebacterium sp. H127]|uniref:hypothetical protein n=1 Tax=Corynebacterium sp. H127 TaxID=3133418 RepID=UPI0030AE43F2
MVSAAILFEPGWIHCPAGVTNEDDPITGEPKPVPRQQLPGSGLVQQPHWSAFEEITPTSVKDGRILLYRPETGIEEYEVASNDEFISPNGRVWQATSEGMPRGIPRQPPEYLAIQVRRAKEKDHVEERT